MADGPKPVAHSLRTIRTERTVKRAQSHRRTAEITAGGGSAEDRARRVENRGDPVSGAKVVGTLREQGGIGPRQQDDGPEAGPGLDVPSHRDRGDRGRCRIS
jgi:hypothetical protein